MPTCVACQAREVFNLVGRLCGGAAWQLALWPLWPLGVLASLSEWERVKLAEARKAACATSEEGGGEGSTTNSWLPLFVSFGGARLSNCL